jgi:FkbM family methyltransferase
MLKGLARRVAPRWLWSRLRTWKLQRMVAHFPSYTTEHSYAGVRLKVHIRDPLAQGWYDHDWPAQTEMDLLREHGLCPGARVFDIGAHQGIVALLLANVVGPMGEVIAVEALPHNARVCEMNCALNGADNIRTVSAAISDRLGTVDVARDLNAQVRHAESTTRTIRVPAVTIDELSRRHGSPDVLFVDVEGYECHALHGAPETLERHPVCFIEVHAGCGLELAGGTIDEVFRHLPATAYQYWAWTEADRDARAVQGRTECPPGRFFLAAVPRR